MDKLVPATRHYSWGSRTLIPKLLGQPESATPVAELWYGAHPADPSTVEGGGNLCEAIAAHPEQVGSWGDKGLPFLMKLLAADEVLSLQAHPSAAQAEEGFARENALGLDLDDKKRNYKDASHKPELIVALTDFYAMAGFRPLADTRELFAALDCPQLDRYLTMLEPDAEAESSNLRALFTTWITIPAAARRELIDAVVAAAPRVPAGTWMQRVMDTVVQINSQYPGDIGVLGALLLNHIELAPGEAVFLAAGQLHAYVHGLGVEVMANSDNVLRGGLTPKYVDVPELVKVLEFEALADPRVAPEAVGPAVEYPTPVEEFTVDRLDIAPAGAETPAGQPAELRLGEWGTGPLPGPAIALCTAGEVELACREPQPQTLSLAPGQAAWLPAGTAGLTYAGADRGGQLFIARA